MELFRKIPTHEDPLEYKIWFCTGPNVGLSSCSTPLLRLTRVRRDMKGRITYKSNTRFYAEGKDKEGQAEQNGHKLNLDVQVKENSNPKRKTEDFSNDYHQQSGKHTGLK